MGEQITYYEEKLAELLLRLKSQVDKNMDIINREVESSIGEEKYLNVLKGRRLAVSYCLSTLNKIDELAPNEDSYRRQMLPVLIERLKEMVDINLTVIDIDIDEEPNEEGDYESLTEDKFHLVLKARDTAGVDTEWVLKRIADLENELNNTEEEQVKPRQSHAKRTAQLRQQQ